MTDENDQVTPETDETTETPTEVKDAAAVLKKNQELLGKLAKANQERDALTARVTDFEATQKAEEQKRLEKRGEWEKLRESMETSHKTALEAEQSRYNALFTNAARYELAVEISKQELAPGASPERLAKLLLLDDIKPVEKDGKVEWRSLKDDTTIDLTEYIPNLHTAYGEFFAADNNPGGDAPGNKGRTSAVRMKWVDMDRSQRNAAIRETRGDIEAAKKKYS